MDALERLIDKCHLPHGIIPHGMNIRFVHKIENGPVSKSQKKF